MPLNMADLPIGGGFIVGAAVYAAVAYFGTGPEIGARVIDRSGWGAQCERLVQAQVEAEAPDPVFRPNLDCRSTLGMLGAEGMNVCREHGNPSFNFPLLDQAFDFQDKLIAKKRQRTEAKASAAGSRCDCAAAVMVAEHKLPWAVYAGTARLMTPPEVGSLQSNLTRAFHSPFCNPNR